MASDVEKIKKLRIETGLGIHDIKKALEEAKGDEKKAVELLKKWGLNTVAKRAGRDANQGIIYTYTHANHRFGSMVEVNCETDFVARTDGFKTFVHEIALQVASMSPIYVSEADIPAEELKRVRDEAMELAKNSGKPANMLEKIVDGQVKKHFAEKVLMQQTYIKNEKQTVEDFVKENIAKTGENLIVRQFKRIELGVSE